MLTAVQLSYDATSYTQTHAHMMQLETCEWHSMVTVSLLCMFRYIMNLTNLTDDIRGILGHL